MKKVITALGNPILNEELKKIENIQVLLNDIQYKEGIIEILEQDKKVDFIILSEIIPGHIETEELIKRILLINNNIKIIVILEKKNEKLENKLRKMGTYEIYINNQIKKADIINIIEQKSDNKDEIKKEIELLKKLVIENKNNIYIREKNNYKNRFLNKKIDIKKMFYKFKRNINYMENVNIISILGSGGIGKSIISVMLAKAFSSKNKILIIDFDILNNNIHTILGLKKYPQKINKLDKNIKIQELIVKVNKNIDLLSGLELLFKYNDKLEKNRIAQILSILKKEYPLIIIDTSSECFLENTKEIIKNSDKSIFLVEPNLIEIKKSKKLLDIYREKWKINNKKINIVFNKVNNYSIDEGILKNIFSEYKILGKITLNKYYNLIINKNMKCKKINRKINKEYIKIKSNILKIKKE